MKLIEANATVTSMNVKLSKTGLRIDFHNNLWSIYKEGVLLISYGEKEELIRFLNAHLEHIRRGAEFEKMLDLGAKVPFEGEKGTSVIRSIGVSRYDLPMIRFTKHELTYHSGAFQAFDGLKWDYYLFTKKSVPKNIYFNMPVYEIVIVDNIYYGFREGKVDEREIERLQFRKSRTRRANEGIWDG